MLTMPRSWVPGNTQGDKNMHVMNCKSLLKSQINLDVKKTINVIAQIANIFIYRNCTPSLMPQNIIAVPHIA